MEEGTDRLRVAWFLSHLSKRLCNHDRREIPSTTRHTPLSPRSWVPTRGGGESPQGEVSTVSLPSTFTRDSGSMTAHRSFDDGPKNVLEPLAPSPKIEPRMA